MLAFEFIYPIVILEGSLTRLTEGSPGNKHYQGILRFQLRMTPGFMVTWNVELMNDERRGPLCTLSSFLTYPQSLHLGWQIIFVVFEIS